MDDALSGLAAPSDLDVGVEALEMTLSGSITVNRDATLVAGLRLVTAASALWLALQIADRRTRRAGSCPQWPLIGGLYATYGHHCVFRVSKRHTVVRKGRLSR